MKFAKEELKLFAINWNLATKEEVEEMTYSELFDLYIEEISSW